MPIFGIRNRYALAGLVLASACLRPAPAQEIALDGPIAIVNDRVITQRDLRKQARILAGGVDTTDEHIGQALKSLVNEALLAQAKLAASLNERMIEERVKRQLQAEEEKEGRAELVAKLASRGETLEAYRKRQATDLRQVVIFETLALQTGPTGRPAADSYVSPRRLELWYRRHPEAFREPAAVQGRLCLATVGPDQSAEAAEAQARRWLVEARAGRALAEIAREKSSWNPSGGGELSGATEGEPQWVSIESDSSLDPAVRTALAGRSAGLLPDVIRTAEGFAVAEVLAARTVTRRPFSDPEVQHQIERTIQREWYTAQQNATQDELRAQSYLWLRGAPSGGR